MVQKRKRANQDVRCCVQSHFYSSFLFKEKMGKKKPRKQKNPKKNPNKAAQKKQAKKDKKKAKQQQRGIKSFAAPAKKGKK